MKSRTREAEQLLTRMVSCVGICPGPPPVFSGSKSDFGSHRKSGLSTYPQRPLGRKRPWFRSICSPGVWKFRATGQQREWSFQAFTAGLADMQECPSARSAHPSGCPRSTCPGGRSWRTVVSGLMGKSCSAADCCVGQTSSLQGGHIKQWTDTHARRKSIFINIYLKLQFNSSSAVLKVEKLLFLTSSKSTWQTATLLQFCFNAVN